jgi:tRNA pseudouridine38-40 synthase
VHAVGQVASASVRFDHDAATVARALNAQLPPAVRVVSVVDAPADFHARFSATGKTYRYVIANGPLVSPFVAGQAWHVPEALDVVAMTEAAAMLIGTHDFAAFQSTGTPVASSVRTLTESSLHVRHAELPPGEVHPLLVYDVTGTGFLRHMVRAIAGTLVEIGRGRRPAASMAALLAGAGRGEAGATAPACGLYLVRVHY